MLAASHRNDRGSKVGDDLGDEGSITLILLSKQIELLLFEETGCTKLNGALVEVDLIWNETYQCEKALLQALCHVVFGNDGSS